MESLKYYIYSSKSWAQKLVNDLTEKWGEKVPYTEIRESDNGKGFAVKADNFTKTITEKELQELPQDFYLIEQ